MANTAVRCENPTCAYLLPESEVRAGYTVCEWCASGRPTPVPACPVCGGPTEVGQFTGTRLCRDYGSSHYREERADT